MYLNDVVVFETDTRLVWDHAMIALQRLVDASFVVYLKKSYPKKLDLLTSGIKMLGFWVLEVKRLPCFPQLLVGGGQTNRMDEESRPNALQVIELFSILHSELCSVSSASFSAHVE